MRDGLIASNPCTIVGAGSAQSKERPYLSPDVLAYLSPEVLAAIVERMPERHRLMFGGRLRLGELAGLERATTRAAR